MRQMDSGFIALPVMTGVTVVSMSVRQNTAADARFLAAAPALAASETFLDEAELAEY